MLKGKYLNPKYARRRRWAKVALAGVVLMIVVSAGGAGLYHVDQVIRQTMLPASPPLAELEERAQRQYRLQLFGQEYVFSLVKPLAAVQEFTDLFTVPPAPVRLGFQLWAYVTGQTPENTPKASILKGFP